MTHILTFTVYPPAWLPYGRRPLVDISAAGHDLVVPVIGVVAWTMTAFGAASDAAASIIWPRSYADRSRWCAEHGRDFYGVARTQKRHVGGINALFALTHDLSGERPAVVAAIGIDLSDIVMAAGRVRDGPELVAEGKKGADILRTLGTPRRRLLGGMNRLGVNRGYWGPPSTDRTMK